MRPLYFTSLLSAAVLLTVALAGCGKLPTPEDRIGLQITDIQSGKLHTFSSSAADNTTVAKLKGQKKLRALILASSEVTDVGLKDLPSLSGLEELILVNTAVTDGCLDEVAKLTNLSELWLSST